MITICRIRVSTEFYKLDYLSFSGILDYFTINFHHGYRQKTAAEGLAMNLTRTFQDILLAPDEESLKVFNETYVGI